ncbi:MAG: NAD(P)/FAD-dependent oxidoreductase [Clostridia bacterium]|nr:NAD(P)/FAD-dependent oxidoreductase [Clostridia bacterium]
MNNNDSVAVIGAGAAGMAAAIKAAWCGASVVLYERGDKYGRKLGITGKGRCNVTNDCPPREFLASVTKNDKFMYSAAFRYTPADVMAFFESLGVPLKTERGSRVFPASDRAADIVNALRFAVRDAGVKSVMSCRITDVRPDGEGFVLTDGKREFRHGAVIVCTGGLSYPTTGSTGDGYGFAERFGIPVTDRLPSLIPIETAEDVSELSGLTLKNVTLTVKHGAKTVFSEMGEMLFTHFGVSGPLVLSASCHMREDITEYSLEIDLKPAIPEDELDERLVSVFREGAVKDFVNATSHLLPLKLVRIAADRAGIDAHVKAGAVTREARARYLGVLKHFTLTPKRFRPIDEAIVTSGGVDVKSLDPKTMECKSVPGLYFAGEVIDVDAYTGGFNLQIAFSTGFSAGEAAAEKVMTGADCE